MSTPVAMTSPRHPALGVVVASIFFGTSGTARSYLPDDAPNLAIAALRLLLGAIPLLLFAIVFHKQSFRRPNRTVVMAGCAMAAFQVLFFQSISLTGVAIGTMITIGSGPVVASLVEFVFQRRIGRATVIGVGIALFGLALLVFGSPTDTGESMSFLGVLCALGAGACYAGYTQLSKSLLVDGWEGPWVMSQSFSMSALLCLSCVFFVPMNWLTSTASVITVTYLGIATIAVPYALYAMSLRSLTSATVVTLTLIEPVTATVLGAVVLNEHIGFISWCGAAIVLSGLLYSAKHVTLQGETQQIAR